MYIIIYIYIYIYIVHVIAAILFGTLVLWYFAVIAFIDLQHYKLNITKRFCFLKNQE